MKETLKMNVILPQKIVDKFDLTPESTIQARVFGNMLFIAIIDEQADETDPKWSEMDTEYTVSVPAKLEFQYKERVKK